MAAKRKFNGWTVVDDSATTLPSPKGGGLTYVSEVVRTLLLEDGRLIYKCADCDFWNEKSSAIQPHRKVHSVKKAQRMADALAQRMAPEAIDKPRKSSGKLTVGDILDILVDSMEPVWELTLDELVGRKSVENVRWKERALDAEKQLSEIRKMIGGK